MKNELGVKAYRFVSFNYFIISLLNGQEFNQQKKEEFIPQLQQDTTIK